MAAQYTILRSNGTVLTTIQDGTINTTSTSLSLFGRNSSQYGAALDTNFVQMLENFSSPTPPNNPIKGQLWFNSAQNTLNVCPADNTTTATAWITLTSTNSGGTATLGNLVVTGNITSNNASLGNIVTANNFTAGNITVTANITAANAAISNASIPHLTTQSITTGGPTVAGSLTGIWTFNGNGLTGGSAIVVQTGNLVINNSIPAQGIKCDNYMYANGVAFNPSGTYQNGNVSDYLTGSNGITQFTGNIAPAKITTSHIAGGGMISGTWILDSANNASIQATYADLAERFEADTLYDEGTVVELGGDKEITAVVDELSDRVFGVVSKKPAYVMNSKFGYTDETHPPIALSGRVPVKVIGKVKKGDRLVSAGKGKARSASLNEASAFNTIGRALSSKDTVDEGIVTAFVTVK
jgi:hypothetical protein